VREQVAALGLQGRVRFLGVRADVADILRASDMFVLSSRVEGNPLSVMEAMAAGLPWSARRSAACPSWCRRA
jgi:glycosyltransferase involved in cell wall biosynthesis